MTEIAVPFEPRNRAREREAADAAVAPRRYPAPIARQLALARALQRRLEAAELRDHAAMARALGFTRARLSPLVDAEEGARPRLGGRLTCAAPRRFDMHGAPCAAIPLLVLCCHPVTSTLQPGAIRRAPPGRSGG